MSDFYTNVVELEVEENDPELDLEIDENDSELELEVEETFSGGTNDYQKLKNLPSINGTELFDNYDEIDPTVPGWAKNENKPEYTSEEVGAIGQDDELPYAEIIDAWQTVFNS